tara:strand:- start:1111 stop:1545 length:435 start_codon:yes stop_codon:yes gene_type:complete
MTSCWEEKFVVITKDYVINSGWHEFNNFIDIDKMKPKNDSISIDIRNPGYMKLYRGLIEDTSFSYSANVKYNGEDYSKRKVYFNKDNGFPWYSDPHKASDKYILGKLQQETWYLLSTPNHILHYIYIDKSDSLFVHKRIHMTNI